jgi:diguanylate cyclase (GGDEF)-like protein
VTIVFQNITESRKVEREIVHQASHDELTGLINRKTWTDFLAMAVERYNRYRLSFAVLFIDLDKFKTINDTEGHASGDEFLIMISNALKTKTRRGDCTGRFGGDEFVLLIETAMK